MQFLLLGERPFQCSFCHKFFKTKAALKTHEMNHLGTTPQRFKCETCNKPFSLKAHYEVHKRTHTGEKPFSCHFCGKCFNYRGTWRVSLFYRFNFCKQNCFFLRFTYEYIPVKRRMHVLFAGIAITIKVA